MANSPKIIKTKSGDNTLYLEELDETYHSRDGAVAESQHVFIKQGLEHCLKTSGSEDLRIFELGFGTGLNALASLAYCKQKELNIFYQSVELFPLNRDITDQLDYWKFLEGVNEQDYRNLHSCPWNRDCSLHASFILHKVKTDFITYQPDSNAFDVVYFDAFAPKKQAELWTVKELQKCYDALKPQGVLVCYSAAGQFKRDLRSCGFRLETPPGANGKREMTRAVK